MRFYAEITKVEDQDDGTIIVSGVAQSATPDSMGETITADAMKGALPDYMTFANIREMHSLSAAGVTLAADVGEDGVTRIETHIVDPLAITKVKARVYKGFSIGGKVLARDPTDRNIITEIRLAEISLVDRPAHPDAVLTMWKAEGAETEENTEMTTWQPTNDAVKARANDLAKAVGPSAKSRDYLAKARDALLAEHEAEAELSKADDAGAEDDVELAAGADDTAADGEKKPKDGDAEDAPADDAEKGEQTDPVTALTAAVDKALAAGAVAEESQVPAQVTPGLDDVSKAIRALLGKEDIQKSLYAVGRLAELIDSLICVQGSAAWEAAYEGEAPSAAVAELAAAIRTLGAAFLTMASEEVAEAMSRLPSVSVIVTTGADLELADTAKAWLASVAGDTELLAKAAERVTPAEPQEDLAKTITDLRADNDRLSTVITETAPKIDGLAKRLDDQATELAAMRKLAAPAKTAASSNVRAVTKAEDVDPAAAANADQPELSPEAIRKYMDELPEAERGRLLMKATLTRPIAVSR